MEGSFVEEGCITIQACEDVGPINESKLISPKNGKKSKKSVSGSSRKNREDSLDSVAIISVDPTGQVLQNKRTIQSVDELQAMSRVLSIEDSENETHIISDTDLKLSSIKTEPKDKISASDILREELGMEKNNGKVIIDKEDPCSRLHFVQYTKRSDRQAPKRVFECGMCGKEFAHHYTLMRHVPVHTDERNFKCEICHKAFRQMSTLLQHKATHRKVKPFVCDICKKAFTRSSTLDHHRKRHTQGKLFECTFCYKTFFQKGNLKHHLYTHTNERPYKCDICGKGFNQLSNVRCHKARDHLPKSDKLKCTLCESFFKRKSQLRSHNAQVHGLSDDLASRNKKVVGKCKKYGDIRIIKLKTENADSEDDPIDSKVLLQPAEDGILIDPIDTKEMHDAQAKGDTPFALLIPLDGPQVIVKVKLSGGISHMLVAPQPEELRYCGKFNRLGRSGKQCSVQMKVSIVAVIKQEIDDTGEVHFDVTSPSNDVEPIHFAYNDIMDTDSITLPYVQSNITQSVDISNKCCTQRISYSHLSDMNAMESIVFKEEPDIKVEQSECYDEPNILSVDSVLLDASDGVTSYSNPSKSIDFSKDFNKPTEVTNEYEIVDTPVHYILPDAKSTEESTTLVDSSNIGELLEALQNAGYRMADLTNVLPVVLDTNFFDNNQLIITSSDDIKTDLSEENLENPS